MTELNRRHSSNNSPDAMSRQNTSLYSMSENEYGVFYLDYFCTDEHGGNEEERLERMAKVK